MRPIAYLSQIFPTLSMTFVYREVEGLRRRGVDVETFATWRPDIAKLSAEAKHLVDTTTYVYPVKPLAFLARHVRYAVTYARRYWGTLLYLLTRPGETLKNRVRTLVHFSQAICLLTEVKERNVRHLHSHFALNSATIALVLGRMLKIPYSFTSHAKDLYVNPVLLPTKIRDAEFIVTISDYNRRFMQELVPTSEVGQKIHVVHCGVDLSHFTASKGQRPEGKPFEILSVSQLNEKKGLSYLVRACKILKDRNYDFRCSIVGGGVQEELLRNLIRDQGLEKEVRLEGPVFQEELKTFLDRADVFALPCVIGSDGDRDGIPVCLMEAMAMEIPVVSTTVSGLPELIEDGVSGRLAPPEDPNALADALGDLLESADLRAQFSAAGRKWIEKEFTIDKNVERLRQLFAGKSPTPEPLQPAPKRGPSATG